MKRMTLCVYDINHTYALRIKNTSESDPLRSCEAIIVFCREKLKYSEPF